VLFSFNNSYKNAFNELKKRLVNASILALFDPEQEALLEIDASNFVIEAYLT
jgi:RNase H-like domain found in reverse transcriptase